MSTQPSEASDKEERMAEREYCGFKDPHSPRVCDIAKGHDGEHEDSTMPTGTTTRVGTNPAIKHHWLITPHIYTDNAGRCEKCEGPEISVIHVQPAPSPSTPAPEDMKCYERICDKDCLNCKAPAPPSSASAEQQVREWRRKNQRKIAGHIVGYVHDFECDRLFVERTAHLTQQVDGYRIQAQAAQQRSRVLESCLITLAPDDVRADVDKLMEAVAKLTTDNAALELTVSSLREALQDFVCVIKANLYAIHHDQFEDAGCERCQIDAALKKVDALLTAQRGEKDGQH